MTFYGPGATSAEEKVSGSVDGTLILDIRGWESSVLSSMVFGILAQEVVGYNVGIFQGGSSVQTTQRMATAGQGLCVPTHVSMEVWTASKEAALAAYANESFSPGGVGYFGTSGIYTTKDFVRFGENESLNSPLFFANYWKQYSYDDRPISANGAYAFFNNTEYYPPAESGCEDGAWGCLNSCSKAEACTLREAEGKECLMIVMMYGSYENGYLQATISNLGIPAYFCFIGYDDVARYALEAQSNGSAVLFYFYEPDMFMTAHGGLFDRVMLPRALPEIVATATAQYGENGYGRATSNPVNVDYPIMLLKKYASLLLPDLPINSLLSKFSLSDLEINSLLGDYYTISQDSSVADAHFDAACGWVKEKYDIWRLWLSRLPLCDFTTHINYTVSGCNSSDNYRQIDFAWAVPDPENASLPFACDGGYTLLPEPLLTSRSCEWIESRSSVWIDWITSKPECDASFYEYDVSECDSNARRNIKYRWLLPLSSNGSISVECENGDSLPEDTTVDCEYVPVSSPTVKAVYTISIIGLVVLLVALAVVYRDREAPIIKRSQYELLMIMVVGGFFTMASPIIYAGAPTDFICGMRPVLVSTGFTSIFGALVVKSLRVYRVFMQRAMKRTTITLRMMLKVLLIFFLIDALIIGVWGIVAFPHAEYRDEFVQLINGNISRIACRSPSFIFAALLMFWKAILLFLGLYLSFLIRKVSVDFQESAWIFSSALVVLFACLVILPLAYLVDLSAAAFYVFLSGVLILCTAIVIALMIIPKLLRLKEIESSKSSGTSGTSTRGIGDESSTTTQGGRGSASGSKRFQIKPTVKTAGSTRAQSVNHLMKSVEELSKKNLNAGDQ